jgi:hypothetical protein
MLRDRGGEARREAVGARGRVSAEGGVSDSFTDYSLIDFTGKRLFPRGFNNNLLNLA